MVSTKTLLKCLIALISLDIITTLIAVTGTGATELNPLSEMFGFYGFMTLKILVHVAGFYIIYKHCLPSAPLSTRCATVILLGSVWGRHRVKRVSSFQGGCMNHPAIAVILAMLLMCGVGAADMYITEEGTYHNSVNTKYYWMGGGSVDVHASSHYVTQQRGRPCFLKSRITTDAAGGFSWESSGVYIDDNCSTHSPLPSPVSASTTLSNGEYIYCRGSASYSCVVCTPGDGSNSNSATFSSENTYTVSGITACLSSVTLYIYDGGNYYYKNSTALGSSYSFHIFNNHDYRLVFSDGAYYDFTCNGNEVFDYDACIWVYGYTCGVDSIKLYKDDSGWVLDDSVGQSTGYDVYEMPIVDGEDYKISFIDSTIDGDFVVHNQTFSCIGEHVLIDFDRCNWVYPPNGPPLPIYLWTGYDYNIVVFKDNHGNLVENAELAVYDTTDNTYIQKWTGNKEGYALLGAKFGTDHDVLMMLRTFDGVFTLDTTYPANGSALVGDEDIATTNWTIPIKYNLNVLPVDQYGVSLFDVFCGLSEYTPLNPGAFWGMDLSDQGYVPVTNCSGFAMCDIIAEKEGYADYKVEALNWTSKSALVKDYRHNVVMEEE